MEKNENDNFNAKFSTMYSAVERAKQNEKLRQQEIDILDKDVEVYEGLTKTEVEIIWYLRHMPDFFKYYYAGRIRRDFDGVTNYLIDFGYIESKYEK